MGSTMDSFEGDHTLRMGEESVCMCVCVERERERERDGPTGSRRWGERGSSVPLQSTEKKDLKPSRHAKATAVKGAM